MENRNNGKSFGDVKVGNYLYWCDEKMDHISKSLVTNICLILDDKHSPGCCDQTISTIDGIKVTMMSCMMNETDVFIFRHPKTNNTVYVGTSPSSVASLFLEDLNSKIKRLQNFKKRFVEGYGVPKWACINDQLPKGGAE